MKASKILTLLSIVALVVMSAAIIQSVLISPENTFAQIVASKKGKYIKVDNIDVCFCDEDSTECKPCIQAEPQSE